jgi:hypothetical protein
MRRSTVLSLPPQLVFPGLGIYMFVNKARGGGSLLDFIKHCDVTHETKISYFETMKGVFLQKRVLFKTS